MVDLSIYVSVHLLEGIRNPDKIGRLGWFNELRHAGEQSRVLLAQAREEFEKGDLTQASEKGWSAAGADAERRLRMSGDGP